MAGSDGGSSRDGGVRARLGEGVVIPAHPLALDRDRRIDERRQRGLSRYYLAAGAGGLAVGVHTTQFALHDPTACMLKDVWALAAEEMNRAEAAGARPLVRVAGICGDLRQAVAEAGAARELGYHYGLVSLSHYVGAPQDEMLAHLQAVAEVLGVFGFYLQRSVGGVDLPYGFWRRFCEIDNVVAIKIAAFDRYRTVDVVRAVADSGRQDIALYTGNDDNIVLDLTTPYRFHGPGGDKELRLVGGLLGQWAVWTRSAVALHGRCRELATAGADLPQDLLSDNVALTDANGAIFDAAHEFRGCIPGIHEVLRRQGLLESTRCLHEEEGLSPGQAAEIDRVCRHYPYLADDTFVAENIDQWLRG